MCLKHPDHAPANTREPTWPPRPDGDATAPPRVSQRPRCRPRLWELEAKLHCPIIGTCLSLEALRRVARRFRFEATHDEFGMHVEAVGFSQQRNPVSETLQRHLDKTYKLWVDRFARLKDDAAVLALWQECLQRGDVAGPLWAVCTHRAASAATRQQAYGDIHMLSHQVGAGQAADVRRLAHLETDNARLAAELRRRSIQHAGELDTLRCRLGQAEQEARDACQQLAAIGPLQQEIEALRSGQALARLEERLAELDAAQRRNDAQQARLDALQAHNQALARQLEAARSELESAENLLEALESGDEPGPAGLHGCPADCAAALANRCILYVGGRQSLISRYRQIAERLGARLIHHDGGSEETLSRLPDLIHGADAVLCPTDRISHNAYYHVKSHCKRVGKPCLFYKGGGVSGFAFAMARLSRGESSLGAEPPAPAAGGGRWDEA